LYFGSHGEKSNRSWGSRGLVPLDCLPHWGREGVTIAISTSSQKTRRDFYRAERSSAQTEPSEYCGVDNSLKEGEKEKSLLAFYFG
jgi:hypothetical protein